MATETDITPEEKLLRVIQNGTRSADGTETPAEPAEEPTATDTAGATRAVAPPVLADSGSRVMRLVCRVLVLVVLLLAAGGGYEVVRAVPAPVPLPPPPDRAFLDPVPAPRLPRAEDTIDHYARRRIFGRPPTRPDIPDPDPTVLTGWRQRVRDDYRLMGISMVQQVAPDGTRHPVREAIVLDGRSGSMHFLAAGKSLVIEGDHVTVREVLQDAVSLESDDSEMTLGRRGESW